MRLVVDPGALRAAANQLERQAGSLEAARCDFTATGRAAVPDIGKASFYAAADTVNAADRVVARLAGDLSRLAAALNEVADNYQANDRRVIP